jgi:hypothetical protein
MAILPWTNCQIFLGAFDATGRSNQVAVDLEADAHDITTFGSGGWMESLGGLKKFRADASGFQDFAASNVDASLGLDTAGAFTFTAGGVLTVATSSTAHSTAYFGPVKEATYSPMSGSVGDPGAYSLTAVGQNQYGAIKGWLAYPKATITGTADGTSSAALGSQNGKQVHGALHIFAVSGSGSVTFQIQSSADGVTSWTNRKAFAAQTGVGSSFVTDTAVGTTQQYWRIACTTFTSFTSVQFAASFGFAPN